tara:strand:+ start:133780 stop:137367 length:3588 start_codon:yes stop_codon:yes gene_type:complete
MKFQNLTLIFLLIAFGTAYSQNTHLYLKSNTYKIEQNIDALLNKKTFFNPEEVVENRMYFRILSFSQLPDKSAVQELQRSGFELIQYLPKNSYITKVALDANYTNLKKYGVFSVIPVLQDFKKDKFLSLQSIPEWAVMDNNKIVLNLIAYKSINAQSVEKWLLSKNITILHAYYPTNRFSISIDAADLEKIIALPFVQYVEVADPPAEPENLVERTNHRINVVNSSYSGGRKYDGTGVVVSLGDDGIIGPHIDYQGRTDQTAVTSNSGDHGDHVAGIIMGAGNLDPTVEGMAPGSDLIVYDPFDNIYNAPTDYPTRNVRITSTSYGNGCNAGYTSFANLVDQQVIDYPALMHVFSAGNSGSSDCGYGAGSGWGNITGGNKSGKNVIAVGNLSYLDVLSSSSSRGPATDGRIKPDICAVGTNVYSTTDPNSYVNKSGTSMACPGISGTLADLYHAFRSLNGGQDPDAGLIKAILLNTAEDLGNPGPDFKHGWGRVNAKRAVECIENGNYFTDSVSLNATNTHTLTVPANTVELRVMVYWTDPAAAANASLALINDLDITLTDPSSNTTYPWVLDPTPNATTLNNPAVQGVDTLNNMEQITITNPVQGNYTLSVNGTAVAQGNQKYYVVYEYRTNDIQLTYPLGGEAFVPGETQTIRWDRSDKSTSVLVEYTTDNGATWNTLSTVSGSLMYYNWTVPNVISGQSKIRLTQGTSQSESIEPFTIIDVPQNLQLDWACVDSFQLSWSPVSGATQYEVSMLGQKYMDSVDVTNATQYVFHNTINTQEYWVSVKALGNNGIVGRRAIAINKQPGTFGCQIPYDIAVEEVFPFQNGTFGSCVMNTLKPIVKVKNEGLSSVSSIPISYQLNNGSVINEVITSMLNPGDSMLYQFTSGSPAISGNNSLQIYIAYSGDGNPYNDTLNIDFNVVNYPSYSYTQFNEDFESQFLCNNTSDCEATNCNLSGKWDNLANLVNDDIDWRVNSGSTPSSNTGPSTDYNPGTSSGKYIYTEASSSCNFKRAILQSSCIDLSGAQLPALKFAYHMYGLDMGSMQVNVISPDTFATVFSVVDDQGNFWFPETINLNDFLNQTIQIQFVGVTGDFYRSDIALDDISISDLTTIEEINTVSSVKMYPNPANDELTISSNKKINNILITDVSGKVVESYKPSSNQITLSVKNLAVGVYFITIKGEEVNETKRLIIQK